MHVRELEDPADFGAVRAIADAIMYEGYLLYPYRRSSGKNRVRWQFGVLLPRPWALAHRLTGGGVTGAAESWWQQTECLLDAGRDATVEFRIRFLQVQRRRVERLADGVWEPVDSLQAGSRLELSFDEAVPREFALRADLAGLLTEERRADLVAAGGVDVEPVTGDDTRVVRERWPVRAVAVVAAAPCRESTSLVRLRVRIENADIDTDPGLPREEALRTSLIACHTLLAVRGGVFVSLLDPPRWAEAAAENCANVHTFPVLAGEGGGRDVVLSSPILLYDHPRIAPESPGDLHDATEIDEILSLRTLTLTDAEKREARATDPRAAAILDRVDGMPVEVLSRLHGTFRSPESPGEHGVMVGGVLVTKGSRVRLRPRRGGTDPQDMFLDGRIALVEDVLTDMENARHLAVTLEDDPGADLGRWYGRFRYFTPDEVEPLAGVADEH